MRRHIRLRPWRAALGLAAAAALAGGLATAAPALADTGEDPMTVAITGRDRVELSLRGDNGGPAEPQVVLRLATTDTEPEPDDNGFVPILRYGDFRIRIDATGLKGVASVKLPCGGGGPIAECKVHELAEGERHNLLGGIRLDIDDDSAVGDSGSIRITGETRGEDRGVTFTPLTVDVTVGGTQYRTRELSEPRGFRAGDVYGAPVGFRNEGAAGDGAVLRLHGSRGLSLPDRYGNCAYKETTDGDLTHRGIDAICTVPGRFEAGTAYTVAEPLKVRAAGFALDDVFSYRFSAVSSARAKALLTEDGYTRGTGAPLTLEELPDAPAAHYTDRAELSLPTSGAYDLVLTGASAKGGAGDTVTADIGFRNDGPGWISALRPGHEPLGFTVAVPEGARVTKAPDRCDPATIGGGAKGYRCRIATPLREDAQLTFPFELRIDEVVADARGEVTLPAGDTPRESEPSDNTAWIVLNGTGDGQGPGGAADGGTAASPSPGAATEGSSGSSDTSGTSGTSGDSGSSAAGSGERGPGGGLALTGAGGVLLVGGVAVLALGAGAAAVVVTRRRRTA
ncbi:hypothetical protein [Streptomyces sp. NPDC088785]|uniref:hypothetical protein n=1 Tax=Streptomyces sp. NPDC088785 TaxID=3365897 RepID=UPI00380D3D6D